MVDVEHDEEWQAAITMLGLVKNRVRVAHWELGGITSVALAVKARVADCHLAHLLDRPSPPVSCREHELTFYSDRDFEHYDSGPLPPLLREMVDLAELGECYLEGDENHPPCTLRMQEMEWGPHHRCFIGGPEFGVEPVEPRLRHGYIRARVSNPSMYYYSSTDLPGPETVIPYIQDLYMEREYHITCWSDPWWRHGRVVLWRADFMVHSQYRIPDPRSAGILTQRPQ